jgi:hypothetical protein
MVSLTAKQAKAHGAEQDGEGQASEPVGLVEAMLSKRAIKRSYRMGEIGLSEAIPTLMFDHQLSCGEATTYLGL